MKLRVAHSSLKYLDADQIIILIYCVSSRVVSLVPIVEKACPCQDSLFKYDITPSNSSSLSPELNHLCIIDIYGQSSQLSSILGTISLSIFSHPSDIKRTSRTCSMIINITISQSPNRIQCPGICAPLPSLQLSYTWLQSSNDIAISCTLSTNMLQPRPSISTTAKETNSQSFITTTEATTTVAAMYLEQIYWRHVQECSEHHSWKEFIPSQFITPYTQTQTQIQIEQKTTNKFHRVSSIQNNNHNNNNHNNNNHTRSSSNFNPNQHNTNPSTKHLHSNLIQTYNNRRKILGLILWIGSESRAHTLYAQHHIFQNETFHGENSILGWFATDLIYPCKPGTTTCRARPANKARKQFRYMTYMPNTRIPRAAAGWSCAQRRPLRALAHVLMLFDPTFLLLVDDDTYVNLPLLRQRLLPYITTDMVGKPIVIGEFMDRGKISTNGFLVGGAGYLMGHKVLSRLSDRAVREYTQTEMTLDQGLYGKANSWDSTRDSCMGLSGDINIDINMNMDARDKDADTHLFVRTGVRLVDVCVSLMSKEFTCHHSDHAVSRCLFYGAAVLTKGVVCNARSFPGSFGIGMCHEVKHTCDLSHHVTCHRWRPAGEGDLRPVRLYNDSSMYDEFSSGHDSILSYGSFSNATAYGDT
eukprot:gene9244-19185_t